MFFVLAVVSSLYASAFADVYVSPSGSDTAAGTLAAPFKSLQVAVNAATAGSTIYLRAGTYSPTTNIQITKKGTSSAAYTMRPYGTEKVIIDGEGLPYTPAALDESLPNGSRGILHIEGAAFWKFYNLELKNGPYCIYSRDSSDNYYENIITHDCYETGFQIQGAAARNVVVNLDSYRNRDPRRNGESADGFALKEGSGTGNILRGARLWDNVDDGLDFWEFKDAVTVENTVSWGNGFNRWGFSPFEGDGNGFKFGGGDAADIGTANHVFTNCIAFSNARKGFIDNSQPGQFKLNRNTAWNHTADTGFSFKLDPATLTNNVAAGNKPDISLSSSQVASGNSWNIGGTWSSSSFVSVDPTTLKGPRTSTGAIAPSDFLIPKSYPNIGATTKGTV